MEKAIDLTVLPPPNQGPLPLVQRLLLTLNCQVRGSGQRSSWHWLLAGGLVLCVLVGLCWQPEGCQNRQMVARPEVTQEGAVVTTVDLDLLPAVSGREELC